MIVNRHRGEVAAEIGGRHYRLCLTLGALAELEAAFGVEDLNALAERFSGGRLSAREMIRIIGAGLRGAGNDITDEAVAAMPSPGGAVAMAELVSELLAATFGGPTPATEAPSRP
jgi:hypothetical protein